MAGNAYTELGFSMASSEMPIPTPKKAKDQSENWPKRLMGVLAKGGIEPPTHGFSVVLYGVNRCTNGPPSFHHDQDQNA